MVGSNLSLNSFGIGSVAAKTYGVSAGIYFNIFAELRDAASTVENVKKLNAMIAAMVHLVDLIITIFSHKKRANAFATEGCECHFRGKDE